MSHENDFHALVIVACERAYQIAFERAVRTGTALIFEKDGQIEEYYPPYKYVLVPIKSPNKKGSSLKKLKKPKD